MTNTNGHERAESHDGGQEQSGIEMGGRSWVHAEQCGGDRYAQHRADHGGQGATAGSSSSCGVLTKRCSYPSISARRMPVSPSDTATTCPSSRTASTAPGTTPPLRSWAEEYIERPEREVVVAAGDGAGDEQAEDQTDHGQAKGLSRGAQRRQRLRHESRSTAARRYGL